MLELLGPGTGITTKANFDIPVGRFQEACQIADVALELMMEGLRGLERKAVEQAPCEYLDGHGACGAAEAMCHEAANSLDSMVPRLPSHTCSQNHASETTVTTCSMHRGRFHRQPTDVPQKISMASLSALSDLPSSVGSSWNGTCPQLRTPNHDKVDDLFSADFLRAPRFQTMCTDTYAFSYAFDSFDLDVDAEASPLDDEEEGEFKSYDNDDDGDDDDNSDGVEHAATPDATPWATPVNAEGGGPPHSVRTQTRSTQPSQRLLVRLQAQCGRLLRSATLLRGRRSSATRPLS